MAGYQPMQDSKAEDDAVYHKTFKRKAKAVADDLSETISTLPLMLLLWNVCATSLLGTTAWISQAKFSTSSTLTLLRISQGLLSTCSTFALAKVFESLQWALTGREDGVHFLSLLGLSPTTGAWGAAKIITAKKVRVKDRLWPLLRIFLAAIVWLSGVLLFAKTSLVTGYDSVYTYNATAGVGQFNGSYVEPYIQKLQNLTPGYPYRVMPYTTLSMVYSLVNHPMHSVVSRPINCTGDDCDSYLLTGGLVMTTPWPPLTHPSEPVIQVFNAPSIQVEFKRDIEEGENFTNEDCAVFGDYGQFPVGIKLCLAQSRRHKGSILAGLYVCSNGTMAGKCQTAHNLPNLTTFFSVYSRTADVVAFRSNSSIVSTSNLGKPVQNMDLDLKKFKAALSWLLDFNAANIPATSSIAEHFWTGQQQLSNKYWSRELYQTFQSILVFPLWKFNPNNFGNVELSAQEITASLPPKFHTTAAIASPYIRIQLNIGMFVVFLILQAVVLLFTWGVFFWLALAQPTLPNIASFPLFDFLFKTRFSAPLGGSEITLQPKSVLHMGDDEIISEMNGIMFFLQSEGAGRLSHEELSRRSTCLNEDFQEALLSGNEENDAGGSDHTVSVTSKPQQMMP